jgi:predicted dehydrogenase
VFSKDLLTDPTVRGTDDVRHEIVAVSSSTSADRAASFIKKIDGPSTARLYGSYAELVADADIDIVYIATPHSHHFQNAMLALEAGKNVLCEKALTVTAAQTKKIYETARAKKLFFMEAVWTRYFPLSVKIRELITSGAIGNVYRTVGMYFLLCCVCLCVAKGECANPCPSLANDSRPQLQQQHRHCGQALL